MCPMAKAATESPDNPGNPHRIPKRWTLPGHAPCHNWGMETELLTLRKLARVLQPLGVTAAWLEAEALAGRLPCLRVPRGRQRQRLLFNAEAVKAALAQRAAGVEHD